MQADWKDELLAHRRAKDQAFSGDGSPVPLHERRGFRGLAYYEPDARFAFDVALSEGTGDSITVARTGGDEVVYERAGTFIVPLPDGPATLTAYRTGNEEGAELFIPFRDATSGKETYGAGRYVEAEPRPDGRYHLDLNRAYHPFCAYNDAFSCPLPPKENWLRIPVRAGERLPGEKG